MRIIISPAKKMNIREDLWECAGIPCYLPEAEVLKEYIQKLNFKEVKEIWCCNDKIAKLNYRRFQEMDLSKRLTPALLAFEGLQYQYMKPEVFTDSELEYVQKHLRILSGFYGILRPLDGVVPYRLEMQAKIKMKVGEIEYGNLYDFWGERIACETIKCLPKESIILNLASKEYSKTIEPYLGSVSKMVNCVFGREKVGKNGELQLKVGGTQAKMLRGEMVRHLAVNKVSCLEGVKDFEGLGFKYCEVLSDNENLVFLNRNRNHNL